MYCTVILYLFKGDSCTDEVSDTVYENHNIDTQKVPTASDCRALCEDTAGCEAWTWASPTLATQDHRLNCDVKSGIGNKVTEPGTK